MPLTGIELMFGEFVIQGKCRYVNLVGRYQRTRRMHGVCTVQNVASQEHWVRDISIGFHDRQFMFQKSLAKFPFLRTIQYTVIRKAKPLK